MISPESLEEESGDGKRMMEGESSRGDSPEKKRVRVDDDPEAEAICAMEEKEEEQQQQQMIVDVHHEAAIQEEWKPSLKLYTREEYTMDDLERLDRLMERHRAEQLRLYAEELKKQKAERKLDHKEIQRVQTILGKVESLTHRVRRVPTHFTFTDETSMKEFFVLDPWNDKDFRNRDPEEPSLDLYYKRLFPIVKPAHIPLDPYLWNRVPEVDEQYLFLYFQLCGLVNQDEQSYILHLKSPIPDRIALFDKAKQIAKELELTKLEKNDVIECIQDMLWEGDIIAEHKLKAEYDMFLLECKYEKSSPSGFISKYKTPLFECVRVSFLRPTVQQSKFDKWMENRRHMICGKEEHLKAIEALYAQNLREDCRTRIRFIKLKRAWAKEHGIISEETWQQGHGDMNEATVGV